MLALLNDDDYPKIRKSFLICLILICVVAHYEVGIKFPQLFFDLPDRVIEPKITLFALWTLCAYFGLRFRAHYLFHRIRYQARLDHNKSFAAKAEHYKNEIKSLRDQTDSKLRRLESTLEPYQHFLSLLKDVDDSLARTSEALDRVSQTATLDQVAAFSREIKGGLGTWISEARDQKRNFEIQVGFLKERLDEVKTGRPLLEDLMAEPSIKHFERQADAETKSGEVMGRDHLTSLVAAVLLLLLAMAATLKFYFL